MKTPRAQFAGCVLVVVAAALLLVTACGGGGGATAPPPGPRPPTILTDSLPDGYTGKYYEVTLRATGGSPPYTWIYPTIMPPGLTGASGSEWYIMGIPTEVGTYSLTLEVWDSKSQSAKRTYTLVIKEGLLVATTSLPNGLVNEAYSATLQATGGTPPYNWSLDTSWGQGLPTGLTLDSTGTVSGTPAWAGGYGFSARVRDTENQSSTGLVSLWILERLSIVTSPSLPGGNVGIPYSWRLYASGGTWQHVWTLEPGSTLPPGLTLNPGGAIEGTPSVNGNFAFTVGVTDQGPPAQSATGSFNLNIENKLTIYLTTAHPPGVATKPYSFTLGAVAGTPPYTWSIAAADPAGVFAIHPATGELTGAPPEPGTYQVRARVTDSSVPFQSDEKDIYIDVRPLAYIRTTRLPDAAQGVWYSANVEVGGGIWPYTLRVVFGQLPEGLTFPSYAEYLLFPISGTPTNVGTYGFTLELIDSSLPPSPVTQGLTLRVNERLRVTTSSLPEGNMGDPYSATLTASGGVPAYTWYASFLPRGLYLKPEEGLIVGVPSDSYGGTIHVEVRDSGHYGQWASQNLPIRITGHPKIRTSRLPKARLGTPYRVTLSATGDRLPFNWSLPSGSLPSGLSLVPSSGEITGAPSNEETQSFTVRLQDSAQPAEFDERSFSIEVASELGRNDTIVTATPISNGTFRASLSPYADPADGPANPDEDYYALTATPGAIVTVETKAAGLVPSSPLDTVIEILDSAGARFSACRLPENPYGAYDSPCLNDDIQLGYITDSKLEFQVPGEPGIPVPFYLRVLDWSGSARPDFVYVLTVSGAD